MPQHERSSTTSTASPSTPCACTGCGCDATEPSLPSVDRRTALGQGVMTAVAAVLGTSFLEACAHTPSSASTAVPFGTWALRVKAADFPALASVGGIARVDGESDKPVAVVRTGDDQYAAFSLKCPHARALVNPVDGGFLCSGHGAQFGPDGVWKGGHAAKNLASLAVEFDQKSGVLTITG